MSNRKSGQVVKRKSCSTTGCHFLGSTATTPTTSDTDTDTISSTVSASSVDPPTTTSTSTTDVPTTTLTAAQSSTTTPVVAAVSSTSNAGTIAGSVVGGVVFLVLVVLAVLLYLRARKRRRTPPSAEFINSYRAGPTPALRLGSSAGYTPTLVEKSSGHTHYPPTVPPPFSQNAYYTSPPMQDHGLMVTDMPPSRRPSAENTLRPQRFSSQANDLLVAQYNPSTSIGSRRELWGSETEIVSNESSLVRLSPLRADSALQFAPRFSLDGPSPQPLRLSHSPTSLQPLRRQPE